MTYTESDSPVLGRLLSDARRNRVSRTQPEIADLLGVSRNAVVNWETNRSLPSLQTIRPLAQAYGLPWRTVAKARAHDLARRNRLELNLEPAG
jgi:transcriptional regulator with XRE-family HTH domain